MSLSTNETQYTAQMYNALLKERDQLKRELAEATAGRCTCSGCGKTVNNAWRNSDGCWCLTCQAKELAEARKDTERLNALIELFNEFGQIDSLDFQAPIDRADIDAARAAGKAGV